MNDNWQVSCRLDERHCQIALVCLGHFVAIESDGSPFPDDDDDDDGGARSLVNTDRLSTVSDDPTWSGLADGVKDILRMNKYETRQQTSASEGSK